MCVCVCVCVHVLRMCVCVYMLASMCVLVCVYACVLCLCMNCKLAVPGSKICNSSSIRCFRPSTSVREACLGKSKKPSSWNLLTCSGESTDSVHMWWW